jgi:hypothetical protein
VSVAEGYGVRQVWEWRARETLSLPRVVRHWDALECVGLSREEESVVPR